MSTSSLRDRLARTGPYHYSIHTMESVMHTYKYKYKHESKSKSRPSFTFPFSFSFPSPFRSRSPSSASVSVKTDKNANENGNELHRRRAEFVAACCLNMKGVCKYLISSSSSLQAFNVRLPLPAPPSSEFDTVLFDKKTVSLTGLSRDKVVKRIRRALRRRRERGGGREGVDEGADVPFSVWIELFSTGY